MQNWPIHAERRRVPVLFLEVDGLWVHLQQQQRKSTEEKMLTVHEGWQPRYSEGKSGGYETARETAVQKPKWAVRRLLGKGQPVCL
jgi:hypothetical protein